jgi:hypothetical protein
MAKYKGLVACEEALERLTSGKPKVVKSSDSENCEITPAMVSVEAGFNKGYLKRSRKHHEHILTKISNLLKNETDEESKIQAKLKKALKDKDTAVSTNQSNKVILDNVLLQKYGHFDKRNQHNFNHPITKL